MPGYRKLSRPSDQRRAILRNQVTALLWNGRIETTEARAKEVRAIAEKLITIAMKDHASTTTSTRQKNNDKGQRTTITTRVDSPEKLHARRQIMAYLYDVKEKRKDDESKSDYKERTAKIKHPVVEKVFNEIAPKYDKLREENKAAGGYTRILKLGPRRGDAAEMVILELV